MERLQLVANNNASCFMKPGTTATGRGIKTRLVVPMRPSPGELGAPREHEADILVLWEEHFEGNQVPPEDIEGLWVPGGHHLRLAALVEHPDHDVDLPLPVAHWVGRGRG